MRFSQQPVPNLWESWPHFYTVDQLLLFEYHLLSWHMRQLPMRFDISLGFILELNEVERNVSSSATDRRMKKPLGSVTLCYEWSLPESGFSVDYWITILD